MLRSAPGAGVAVILYYKVMAELGPRLARLEERYNSLKERLDRLGECVGCMATAEPEALEEREERPRRPSRIDLVIASLAVGSLVLNAYMALALLAGWLTGRIDPKVAIPFAILFGLEAWKANRASDQALQGNRRDALTNLLLSTILILILIAYAALH